jgi:hypothetical protein
LVPGETLLAFTATAGIPAESNPIPDLQALCMSAKTNYLPHYSMTRNKWISGDPPLVVEHREITVADSAAFNSDLYLLGSQWTSGVLKGLKGLFRTLCCESLY